MSGKILKTKRLFVRKRRGEYKVLITGSSGMLGIDLSHSLLNDYEVYGLDLVRSPYSIVRSFYKSDITDKKNVLNIIKGLKPDIVIHSAALTDVDGCEISKKKAYKINSEGTKNIALACKAAGSALVYVSTDFVFDGNARRRYREDDKPNPISTYGDSKLRGEEAVKKILKRYFILRTSWLYGNCGKNFVDTILSKAKTKKTLKVVNDQVGTPTYTKDLAKVVHLLLNKIFTKYGIRNMGYGVYHVSNSGSVSWYEYAKAILGIAQLKTRVTPISSEELGRAAKRPSMSVLDNSKFIKFTGYRMRNWKDALKEHILRKAEVELCCKN